MNNTTTPSKLKILKGQNRFSKTGAGERHNLIDLLAQDVIQLNFTRDNYA